MKPTYKEIATDFAPWGEYVDPSGLFKREEEFDTMTVEQKIRFMIGCFGSEVAAVDA
jgi:hypothetical protein